MPSLIRQINTISRCAGIFRSEKLAKIGAGEEYAGELNSCHHIYVIAISKHPGLSGEELAKRLCVNKSNVARNLSYLEEKGYVKREQSGYDKRVTLCFPTEKMLTVLPEIQRISKEFNAMLTEDLSKEEAEMFYRTIEKLAQKAKEIAERSEK